jgi:hypothetical protein
LALLVLASCQTGPKWPVEIEGTEIKIDPCVLVTKHDARRAMGEEVKDGQREVTQSDITSGTSLWCGYAAAKAESAGSLVSLDVAGQTVSPEEFDKLREYYRGIDAEARPVSGTGDEAFFTGFDLWVRKGDVAFLVGLFLPNLVPTDLYLLEREEELARRVLDRLP